ncbi:putative ankyrin repeat protein RF_0381 [Cotesia glomerata]|uniref:putative ankyrin repeat protein RF_0381 n=1 Tax=Cotesia glomerata TaxID=32391 RepID=UPI001D0134EA|nr:putative ankyrin repeat protein RF_0381 [Cotesia glomerata]
MAVNSCGLSNIQQLIECGHLNVNSIFFLDQYKQMSILQFAILNSYDDLIDYLLKNHVDLNASTDFFWTALHVAIEEKKLDVVQKLVFFGADINILPNHRAAQPPLHQAIQSGTYDITEFLVKSGADVNFIPYKVDLSSLGWCSWSPLNLAISLMNIPVIELLLKHNAIIDQGSSELRSSLQLALLSHTNSIEIFQILEKFGAKFEIIKDGKYTLEFLTAVGRDNIEIFNLFVKKCDNFLDISNRVGDTIAHEAVLLCSQNILRYLLDCGINVNVVNIEDNESFLDVAKAMNETYATYETDDFSIIVKMIKKHIIKLSAAGLYVNTKNSKAVNSRHFRSFREKCVKEISELKIRKISDTNFNYFDVVVKNVHRLAVGLRHSDFCFIEDKILTEFQALE